MGTSRDSFYRIKELYNTGGEEALREIGRHCFYLRTVLNLKVEEAVVQMALITLLMASPELVMNCARKAFSFLPPVSVVFGSGTTWKSSLSASKHWKIVLQRMD